MTDHAAPHDLHALRESYRAASLRRADLADTWEGQFERWLADAIATRARPGMEPNAMVLATADAAGRPTARTVLLKEWSSAGFVLFTNLGSRKARQVAENPFASLLFPWLWLERQVVVTGRVEGVPEAVADEYFASRPRGSQLGAWASPQSEVIESRAVLEDALAELEARFPEGTPIPRPEGWGGLRVVPDSVELWQGRPDRLHDRFRYVLGEDGAWSLIRLGP